MVIPISDNHMQISSSKIWVTEEGDVENPRFLPRISAGLSHRCFGSDTNSAAALPT